MDEATSTDAISIIDEISAAIRQAAGKEKVVLIRIAIGSEVTVSKVEMARELHRPALPPFAVLRAIEL